MNFYLDALQQYATFQGKATREQYWMFVLINLLISLALSYVGYLVEFPLLGSIYSLAILLPSIAISVRRLHDIGKGGAWFFINFVPVVGSIWYLILMVTPSKN